MNTDEDRGHRAGHVGVGLRQGPLSRAPAGSRRDPARRVWLRPSVELFTAADGAIYLQRPGEREDLVIRAPTAADRHALAALAGGPVAAAALDPAQLDALAAAGVLVESREPPVALPDGDAERFARQLPWFAEWREPTRAQAALRAAKVVIVGCGGLGCWALGALTCAGVGRFVLIDDDAVSLSNLNRQVLFGARDVGAPKVDRAADWVRSLDPAIDVETVRAAIGSAADLRPHLDGAAAVVLVADRPPHAIAVWTDAACRAARVPFVTASQMPPVMRVGPTYVPGRSACHTCHDTGLRRRHPLHAELVRAHDAAPPVATTLGPASGIVGTILALEVVHLLTRPGPVATEGRAMLLDMRTLEQRWEDVPRLADCPACEHLADGRGYLPDGGHAARQGALAPAPAPPARRL